MFKILLTGGYDRIGAVPVQLDCEQALYHSATAICASQNVKVFANATFWANADVNCGWFDSDATYWATY